MHFVTVWISIQQKSHSTVVRRKWMREMLLRRRAATVIGKIQGRARVLNYFFTPQTSSINGVATTLECLHSAKD